MREDLLRPREVAALFGVHTSTVAQWARDGRLTPSRTPGGHRRYSRAAVLDVLAAGAGPGTAEERVNLLGLSLK